ncbi:hypothetical protein OE88DRAFT_1661064, partial [Heliocybe sulcata]
MQRLILRKLRTRNASSALMSPSVMSPMSPSAPKLYDPSDPSTYPPPISEPVFSPINGSTGVVTGCLEDRYGPAPDYTPPFANAPQPPSRERLAIPPQRSETPIGRYPGLPEAQA